MATIQPYFAALATVAAALIAALVTFLATVLSKEQKTSEFRQQWIDGLRTDLSDLCGEAVVLAIMSKRLEGQALKREELERAIELRYSNLVKARALATRIELRLNPSEHAALLHVLGGLREKLGAQSPDAVNAALDKLVDSSKSVLKFEWDRVKAGEPAFQRTKALAKFTVKALLWLVIGLLSCYVVSLLPL